MPSSSSSPASLAERALDVRDLTGPADVPIIHDVDLDVRAAETVVVIGPNQAGKSTLVRHLVGLERARSGSIAVDGYGFDPTNPDDAKLRELRSRIGVMFERSALLRRISIVENVELPILEHLRRSSRGARDTARELLVEVGVHVAEDSMPAELGRADQRRVALARALALRPRLLLIDEPTLRLDVAASQEFDDTLQSLQERRGFGMLIASHETRYAYSFAAEIAVMADGRIVARGTREALLESEDPVVHRLLHRRERE